MSRKLGSSQGTRRGAEREVCGISLFLVSRVETPRERDTVRGTLLDFYSLLSSLSGPYSLISSTSTLVVTVTVMVTVM
jgi:hypothetical protein